MASSPKKQMLSQRKLSGVASYTSSCKKEWEQKYPISLWRTDKEFRCNVCLCNFSCSPQGEADVKRHCDGANHIKDQKAFKNTRLLSSFSFTKVTDPFASKYVVEDRILRRLGKCMRRSVKPLKFQINLWS